MTSFKENITIQSKSVSCRSGKRYFNYKMKPTSQVKIFSILFFTSIVPIKIEKCMADYILVEVDDAQERGAFFYILTIS